MIHLSELTPLGTGRHRKCYPHPDDAQRCIKIVYNSGHGGDKETRRELKYYAQLSRRLKDWSGIPRYYGTVETDCGTGYVYDVITDFDGKPSVTLTEFVEQCRYPEDAKVLRHMLKVLKRYLHNNRIVTMTLKPQNILCRRISESEVVPVVCDNIGEGTLIPLATWSGWFCRRKLARSWERFIAHKELAAVLDMESDAHLPASGSALSLSSRQA
ncbi:PhoP regulatory network protein YrbL [Siccibacter turicensis]|uniref:PhoP regulatory network protein YrbL n=1 Tax=Siccibacter turicensis TaxID=357233 RepID=UPI000467DB52|nr:PhoP regulatory network protein YrbL [Siccibacter turicensis]